MSRDKELASRRSTFRGGRGVRLADGRVWNLPDPAMVIRSLEDKARYFELTRAILEADEEPDRGLAEFALTIFLLNLNYDLSPADHQELLTFEPDSDSLLDWRRAACEIVEAHAEFARRSSASRSGTSLHDGSAAPARFFSRWFSWIWAPAPVRR